MKKVMVRCLLLGDGFVVFGTSLFLVFCCACLWVLLLPKNDVMVDPLALAFFLF